MNTLTTFTADLHQKLQNIKHVALIAHKAPDGDAYGSLEGMKQLLKANYSHLSITIVVPPEKQTDPHASWIISEPAAPLVPEDADLIIFMDASPLSRTAISPDKYPTQPVVTIDHHEPQADSLDGYRDTSAASTTSILTDIAQELHWTITPEAATALLLGVYTDTGGFIHRNTNQKAFETAAFLFSCGADQSRIANEAFGSHTIEYLHDLGRGLLSIVQSGNIACLFFPETENNNHLKSNIIGYLSGLKDVDIACVLMQKWDEVKGSFRTRGEKFDVNLLAQKFWGGGHRKASGFVLEWSVTPEVLTWKDKEYTAEEFIEVIKDELNTKDKGQSTK